MSNIYDLIRNFNNDENVIKLKNYYNSLSFMEILGVDRKETVHSTFLKWLFDFQHNYDLGTKPLMLLLDLLIRHDEKNEILADDKEAIILRQANIELEQIVSEFPLGPKQKYGRVDIYISFNIGDHKYAIALENKVESSENKESEENGSYQTNKYYNYFSQQNNKNDEQINFVYVFLAPIFNGKRVTAKCTEFINISYDDIVKFIINPLLSDDNLLDITKFVLKDYLKVLSKPNVIKPNSESISMLGLEDAGEEKILIRHIRKKHKILGERLKSTDENETLKSFQSDDLNKIIIASAWPDVMTKRNRNRTVTFAELGIEPGTVLYLADGSESSRKDKRELTVTTLDLNTTVKYELNGESKISKLSPAAEALSGNDTCRGISWFIYNDGKRDINLLKYYEEKK